MKRPLLNKSWQVQEIRIAKLSEPVIVDAQGAQVCTLPALTNAGGKINQRAEQIAWNARLIAAAPDLLTACQAALNVIHAEDGELSQEALGLIYGALARVQHGT